MQLPIILISSVLIWIMFLIIPWLWWRGHKETAIYLFLSVGTAWFLSQLIKYIFYIPRPYVIDGLETLVLRTPTDGAFPSSHTASAFALATGLWFYRKDWGMIGMIIALAIGISRVMSHVHYPIDIAGGALLGMGIALVMRRFYKKIIMIIKQNFSSELRK